ncbi:hypothetical protein [Actinomycetospora atypica]|uniref:Uncharacterized protein n=1 Tax=Actinomycetospora atypica TaxID=1290095 RepID=A0ABV9YLP4_9PSEU
MPRTDLSRGPHADPTAGACLMERVSAIAGEPFSDRPSCTHPALAALAQQVNDRVSDAARDRLLALAPALADAADDDPRAAWRLVAVCAEHALALAPGDHLATRLRARAARADRRWTRVRLDGLAGRAAGLRALPHLTAAFHRLAVLSGPSGSAQRDEVLVAMLTDAVSPAPAAVELAAA